MPQSTLRSMMPSGNRILKATQQQQDAWESPSQSWPWNLTKSLMVTA